MTLMMHLLTGIQSREIEGFDTFKIAENIFSIASTVRKSLIPLLYKIGFTKIHTNDEEKVIARSLDAKQILGVFHEVSKQATHATNHNSFSSFMKQIIRIISNKFITSTDIQPFMRQIINSRIPFLKGAMINNASPPNIEAIRFISASIELEKNPNAVSDFLILIKDATR